MTAHPLTPRQLEACVLYAQGLKAKEIGRRMGITYWSAHQYLYHATKRMGARGLGQLMFWLGREVKR